MMRELTQEELEIAKEMDNYPEESEEYKKLQKRLIAIGKEICKDMPFQYD